MPLLLSHHLSQPLSLCLALSQKCCSSNCRCQAIPLSNCRCDLHKPLMKCILYHQYTSDDSLLGRSPWQLEDVSRLKCTSCQPISPSLRRQLTIYLPNIPLLPVTRALMYRCWVFSFVHLYTTIILAVRDLYSIQISPMKRNCLLSKLSNVVQQMFETKTFQTRSP